MLTMKDIQMIASRPERRENSVLTLYLDTDQSKQANRNRGFEKELKEMVAGVRVTISNPDQLSSFATACQQMERLARVSPVAGRGLVAVFDAIDGFFWTKWVDVPLPNRLQWDRAASIQPLVAAIDDYERVAIVLLDRAHLRVLTMSLGEVTELTCETFDQRKVRRTKTAGMNNLAAASHAQHRVDEHVRLNIRQMIKRIESVVVQHSIGRIILAGSSEITAQLKTLMPKRLASRVIGTMSLATNANLEEIRNAAASVAERFERESEGALVTELVTSAAKAGRSVVGLMDTLDAMNRGRIWQLVYADGFYSPGYECAECGALFCSEQPSCSLCGSSVRPAENIVERLVARVARKGAKIEIVGGEDARPFLVNAGGVGAFLRTRTASARAS
jgi:hypothetical protein